MIKLATKDIIAEHTANKEEVIVLLDQINTEASFFQEKLENDAHNVVLTTVANNLQKKVQKLISSATKYDSYMGSVLTVVEDLDK